jgi:nucleoside-diphosphate-sugar epimerase
MKIFITGATGFIGRNLVEYYKDHDVIEYKRGEPLFDCLLMANPDVIINCAAEIYNPDLMWEANIGITATCLGYLKGCKNKKMIQIGSSSEYGPMPRASSETDRINPVDMYQATKGMATILCQGAARTYDLDVKIARPYSVYGKYEKPHRLFPRLWKAFVLDQPMKLYDGYHDFIFIDDFVRGIDILLNSTNSPSGDIVNFGSGIQYSNFEVLQVFEKITGKTAPIELIKNMAKSFETEIWCCDTWYAANQYNFKTEYSLEFGISKFLETASYNKE